MSALNEEEFTAKKVQWSTWKKLLSYAGGQKAAVIRVLTFMGIVAGIDVLMPYLNAYAIDRYITPGVTAGLWKFSVLFMLTVLTSAAGVYSFIYNAGLVETGICHDIRRDGFSRLQQLSFSYYDKTPVGYMMARMNSDAQRLADTVAWSMVDLCWGVAFMIIALTSMLLANWKLALIMVAVLPPLAVVTVIFQQKILRYQREVRKLGSRITGAFNEGIMGARTTKTLVREDGNFKEFSTLTGDMRTSAVHSAIYSALFMPIVMTLGTLGTAFVLWRGGIEVQFMGLSLGEFSFFLALSTSFFEPVRQIATIFAELQNSQAAAERVFSLIESPCDVEDTEASVTLCGDAFHPKRDCWPALTGDITFENVSFQYKGGESVLKDFNLHIPAGQTLALVGETGSGKSTLVNLICRFYEPTTGRILIDGVDYKERSQIWLHSNLGYVLQSPHLFSGSIRENIRYGNLAASDEQVEEAARMVGADAFVSRLEEGYDTDVGEGGNRLSTGEKQLISFARAIIADPAIFVLDEATSSIDTETEVKIQSAIETVLRGRTSFIIAHRLSTIRHADRILVIDHGQFLEQGNHHELMARRGHYYELYTNQFLDEQQRTVLGKELATEE